MKPRTAFFVSLALAALIGFGWSGAALYKTAIDLTSAAFPAGAQIQAAVDALGISYPRPVAGVVCRRLQDRLRLRASGKQGYLQDGRRRFEHISADE